MADNLPAPESRVESYLAKAAGEDVTIPDKPLSRTEQYLAAIAEGGGGGGGGSYTAGTGIDITNNEISVDTGTIQEKLTAGTNITIADNVISATGGGSVTPVQSTGTSTTDVMSQNAVTSMVFADAGTNNQIQIGDQSSAPGSRSVAIGYKTDARSNSIAIGNQAKGGTSNTHLDGIAIGVTAKTSANGAISLGAYSQATQQGEMNIGTTQTSDGYNNSNYRLLSGLYDPQTAHDAATKGYVDGLVGNVASALNAINNGTQS